jgi:hypothetical protein
VILQRAPMHVRNRPRHGRRTPDRPHVSTEINSLLPACTVARAIHRLKQKSLGSRTYRPQATTFMPTSRCNSAKCFSISSELRAAFRSPGFGLLPFMGPFAGLW